MLRISGTSLPPFLTSTNVKVSFLETRMAIARTTEILHREASTTCFACLCMIFYRYILSIGFYASQFWNLATAFFDFYKCELFFLKVEKGCRENLRICYAEKPRRHALHVSVWYSTDTFLRSASMLRNSGTSLSPFLTSTRNKARFSAGVPSLLSPKIFRRENLHTGEVKKNAERGFWLYAA